MKCWFVSYQWECVGDFAIRGQLSAKAIGRKELVTVIVLDNLTHRFQGHGICIHLVRAHIVERGGLGWITLQGDKQNKIKRRSRMPPAFFVDVVELCELDA